RIEYGFRVSSDWADVTGLQSRRLTLNDQELLHGRQWRDRIEGVSADLIRAAQKIPFVDRYAVNRAQGFRGEWSSETDNVGQAEAHSKHPRLTYFLRAGRRGGSRLPARTKKEVVVQERPCGI